MKIVNNITYCDEFSNEFTKLYNDTYQILSGYDTIDACAAAIIDFTKHVQLGKMDSFWVNFVSIHQSMEYKNTLPEVFENKNIMMLETPAILIGWQSIKDTVSYYWLRIINTKPNILITKNIGDILKTDENYSTFGIDIVKESDLVPKDSIAHISIGGSLYYTLVKGITDVMAEYSTNAVKVYLDDTVVSRISKTTPSKVIGCKCVENILGSLSDYDQADRMLYPFASDEMDTNVRFTTVAMIHDFLKRDDMNRVVIEFVVSSDKTSEVLVLLGYQVIADRSMLYFAKVDTGTVVIDVYSVDGNNAELYLSQAVGDNLPTSIVDTSIEVEAALLVAINNVSKATLFNQ